MLLNLCECSLGYEKETSSNSPTSESSGLCDSCRAGIPPRRGQRQDPEPRSQTSTHCLARWQGCGETGVKHCYRITHRRTEKAFSTLAGRGGDHTHKSQRL